MKVYIYTLGCRVNQCESEAIAESFAKRGHTVLDSHTEADLIIVNTCTVTSKAEQKARREIRLFAKERSPERAVEPDNYNTLQHGTFINIQTSAVEA